MSAHVSVGQDFMMQGWYWDYPKTAQGHNWADTLQQKLAELHAAGITQLWLPPLSRASFGNGSNGYDPKDLYDLGEYGGGATGFGTRAQLDQIISSMEAVGMIPVADVVYNHRDGGRPEVNGAVEGWIENYTCAKASAGDNCYPSDRYRCFLPLGGSSGNGAGNYYFKIRSASKHPNFYGKEYKFYLHTNTVGFQGLSPLTEVEPNGGGDCGQGLNAVQLGRDMVATIDNTFGCGGSCGIDEFELVLQPGDFNASGDTLWIYLTNPNGNYSDHYVWGLYSTSVNADIQGQVRYQTYTDFSNLPSGQGAMNFSNFKPNGNPTNLGGDWDTMLFFYDYDQGNNDTAEKLIQWSKWLWQNVGIRGLRMDAVKHFNPAFVGRLLDSLHTAGINPPMVVGEFYDDSTPLLKNWNDQVRANMSPSALAAIDVRVFDFGLRRALKDASDLFGYDVRNVFNAGLVDGAGASPFSSVTFVNNHDFRDEGQPIYNDPLLGYAYILTNNRVGLPCIFYPDYYGVTLPHGPDDILKPDLDQLMAIHRSFIVGASSHRYINRFGTPDAITYHTGFPNTTLLYQLSGGGTPATEVVVAINYAGESLDVSFPVQNIPNGTVLFDKTGKSLTPEVTVEGGRVRAVIPARSYAIFQKDSSFDCNRSSRLYVNAAATGLNNGSSWKDAYQNLQAAIALANQCTDIEEIWVAAGTYRPDHWERRD